jgi:hypothetical protein
MSTVQETTFPAQQVIARTNVVVRTYYLLGAILLAALVWVAVMRPGLVTFWPFSAAEFVQTLAPLVLMSAIIERGVEVFLTPWRAEGGRLLDRAVATAKQSGDASALLIQEERKIAHKSETQRLAFLMSVTGGIVVSALGIRAVEMFVDPEVFQALPAVQENVFHFMDVIFTGAMLGGGADGIHKLVNVVVTFMEKTAARTAASTP